MIVYCHSLFITVLGVKSFFWFLDDRRRNFGAGTQNFEFSIYELILETSFGVPTKLFNKYVSVSPKLVNCLVAV